MKGNYYVNQVNVKVDYLSQATGDCCDPAAIPVATVGRKMLRKTGDICFL